MYLAAAVGALGCSASGAVGVQGSGGMAGTSNAGGAGGTGGSSGITVDGGGCVGVECTATCELAAENPSNVGCEFYAVDLDLSDGVSLPGGGPWGVVMANGGIQPAEVVIEMTDTPFGMAPVVTEVHKTTIQPDSLEELALPTREVDCGSKPDDWYSPGTCLSRNAFRIRSSSPIVVHQFNNLVHGFSTDASLLLPVSSLGTKYRVTGWPVAHSYPSPGAFVQRGYVTIVGTEVGTKVTVNPSWRIRGGGVIAATPAGGKIETTLGPFEVLNLETDDATLQECFAMMTPPYCADLTGTAVEASAPVAVFTGTEESGVGLPEGAPKPPFWDENSTGCCNQHLEEQLMPAESFGKKFLVTRSPIRSNAEFTTWEEPDVLRFVGAAAPAQVTTTLPAPFDSFTLAPGEVKDTWTQRDIVVTSTEPIVVAQLLIGEGYVGPQPKGDPSLTIFPAIEQARTEYVFLSMAAWKENWVVIGAETGAEVTIDGTPPADCTAHEAGTIEGKAYEARRCQLAPGVHRLESESEFQIMAYGYSSADAYSFAGGADIEKIYVPPPLF